MLYTDRVTLRRHYAEGVVFFDGAVFIRDFAPSENRLWGSLDVAERYFRDCEDDLRFVRFVMLDTSEVQA